MSDTTKADSGRRAIINRETLLPLGVVVALMTSVIVVFMWLDDRFDRLEAGLAAQHTVLMSRTQDRWTGSMQERWAWKLQESMRDQLGTDAYTPAAFRHFKLPDPSLFHGEE